jgi:hypothetical protein
VLQENATDYRSGSGTLCILTVIIWTITNFKLKPVSKATHALVSRWYKAYQ